MTYCCSEMKKRLTHKCDMHDKYECPDHIIDKFKDGAVGIMVKDGGSSMIVINFCPWCAADLRGRKISASEYDKLVKSNALTEEIYRDTMHYLTRGAKEEDVKFLTGCYRSYKDRTYKQINDLVYANLYCYDPR